MLRAHEKGGMIFCRLCGLTLDEIPENSIQIGKLYRSTDGSYHYLRKKPEPRTGPHHRKSPNPCSEAPPPMGTNAREVPDPPTKQKKERTEKKEVEPVPTETLIERTFRLART